MLAKQGLLHYLLDKRCAIIAMTLRHIIFDLIPFANAFNICSACDFACDCLFPLIYFLIYSCW